MPRPTHPIAQVLRHVFCRLLDITGLDFGSILMGFGKILGRSWEGFGKAREGFASILGDSGPLWTILGCWGVLG